MIDWPVHFSSDEGNFSAKGSLNLFHTDFGSAIPVEILPERAFATLSAKSLG
jgi:hypothetical protein